VRLKMIRSDQKTIGLLPPTHHLPFERSENSTALTSRV
jgi:hypothetical protein